MRLLFVAFLCIASAADDADYVGAFLSHPAPAQNQVLAVPAADDEIEHPSARPPVKDWLPPHRCPGAIANPGVPLVAALRPERGELVGFSQSPASRAPPSWRFS